MFLLHAERTIMLSDGFINKLNCGNHNICVCQIITLYTLSSYNNAFFSLFFFYNSEKPNNCFRSDSLAECQPGCSLAAPGPAQLIHEREA